jgi:hypothetical protein
MIAILTRVAVARKNVDAGELDGPVAVFQSHELEQPHHGGKLKRDGDTVDFTIIHLEDFDLTLPKERDGLLPMEHPKRLVRGVEEQRHFHGPTSFATSLPEENLPRENTFSILYAISFF